MEGILQAISELGTACTTLRGIVANLQQDNLNLRNRILQLEKGLEDQSSPNQPV